MKNAQKQIIEKELCNIPNRTITKQKYSGGSGMQEVFSEEFQSTLNGKGKLCSYSLYPGITLSFFYLLTDQANFHHEALDSVLEISYCRYGRIGWEMQGNTLYLGPGDFSVHSMAACANSKMILPAEHYEGLMISIDLEKFSADLPELLGDTGITGESLYQKFCTENTLGYFPGNEHTSSIFNSFFGLPKNLQMAYFKLKVQELLLYLHRLSVNKQRAPTQYQSEQIDTIKQIHAYLMDNLEQRITIEMLSKKYLMNSTTLKEVFKTVYGVSIATHMKEHRMEKAAALLRESKRNIEEIARLVGYESHSKFTVAFKSHYEITPIEYRKIHS